jgi:cytochrome c553
LSIGPAARQDRRWNAVAIGITAAIAVAAIATGFVILPMLQQQVRFRDIWDAICSAAGVAGHETPGNVVEAGYRTTQVALTPQMLAGVDAESVGRGATLALRCTMCHGARGLSEATSPNLAGQYTAVVYKELKDYQSGARVNAVMTPLAANLSDQDMRDLAAYYAYLPRLPAYHPGGAGPAPPIVANGAPMRNIAPCGSCHGTLDNKTGSPWLEGQPEAYLLAQLRAFATGERHNDIEQQMRNVSRNMTPAEIDASARWYASHQ